MSTAALALAGLTLVGPRFDRDVQRVQRHLRVVQTGLASWYGDCQPTASGERFDPSALTCAHRTLPFGTWLTVRRVSTTRAVRVRVTDRGPFVRGRVIDLTPAAFRRLAPLGRGVVRVELLTP